MSQPLSEKQSQIVKKKIAMVKLWCYTFYSNDYRCIIDYISSCYLSGKEVLNKDIDRLFRDGIRLASQLVDGFLILEKGSKKEKNQYYVLNIDFLSILSQFISKIKQKINEKANQIKKYKQSGKKKYCLVCKVEKTQSQLKFLGNKCECSQPNFVEYKIQEQEEKRIKEVQEIITKLMAKKIEIQNQQQQIQKQRKAKKDLDEKQLSQYDRYISTVKEAINKKGIKPFKHPNDLPIYEEAYQRFAPKKTFANIQEIRRARAKQLS